MNKANPIMLSSIYGIMTLTGIITWVLSPNLAYYLGASSLTQLFVFAAGSGNKSVFAFLIVILLALAISLFVAVYFVYKKRLFRMLAIVMWLDIIISVSLMTYKLFAENYTNIHHIALGIIVRGMFAITFCRKIYDNRAE